MSNCCTTPQPAGEFFEIDPVCGMKVNIAKAAATFEYKGTLYYFCGKGCAAKFQADPEKFLTPKPAPAAPTPAEAKTEYTCPMDPEVHQLGPGICPKCGMALEPATVSLDPAEAENPELDSMSRRFWVSTALTLPLLAIMSADLFAPQLVIGAWVGWLELTLATPVVLWGGAPFFERGWLSITGRHLNMFTLIALGTGTSYGYSLIAQLFPQLFPATFRMASGQVPLYFEASAVIICLVLLGQVLELRARSQTGTALKALLSLAPKTARRINPDGSDQDVPIAEIQPNDRLRVRPGEKIPVDGTLLEGSSTIDESMISGEPIPVEKSANAKLTAGTINGTGSFIMRAERVGAQTLLAQIVQLVAQAQRTRAPIQRVADSVAAWFVPIVLLAAVATFGVWATVGPQPRLAHALINAVAVLMIACPCALGLATPIAIMVGTGRAAHAGILFRSAEALETLGKIDTLVLDKTGTLTQGKPAVTATHPAEGTTSAELLRIAASLERASEHPLAAAVLAAAKAANVTPEDVQDFQSTTGKGLTATLSGQPVLIGNRALLESANIPLPTTTPETGTTLYVASAGKYLGSLTVEDPLKPSAAAAIQALQADQIRIVILTGDTQSAAEAVAKHLGIDAIGSLLPAGKADWIKQQQSKGRNIAMAGDGVNDAPALAQANVGIAMGTGTDVAIQTAAVTLISGDLAGLARARRLSHLTLRNIKQNLFFAFLYNGLGVPLAAGVLYPAFHLLLNPMLAAAAMSLSSVSVIANALRLRTAKL